MKSKDKFHHLLKPIILVLKVTFRWRGFGVIHKISKADLAHFTPPPPPAPLQKEEILQVLEYLGSFGWYSAPYVFKCNWCTHQKVFTIIVLIFFELSV